MPLYGPLLIWCALTIFLIGRYAKASQAWAISYRGMTNDIVEKMVGHRTRLVQEDPLHWHDLEDKALEDYLHLSEDVDRIGVQINSVVSRGWTIVGLSGLAISFVTSAPTAASLAIGLGGILLATQGLNKLAGGSQSSCWITHSVETGRSADLIQQNDLPNCRI